MLFVIVNSVILSGCFDGGNLVMISWNDSGISMLLNVFCSVCVMIIVEMFGVIEYVSENVRKLVVLISSMCCVENICMS